MTKLQEALLRIRMQKQAAGPEDVPPEMLEAASQQVADQPQPTPEEMSGDAESGAPSILDMLIGAYCAEVEAAFQYEWAMRSCLGKARNYLVSECDEHRKEEWEHAEWLAERIDTLGGVIPFTLEEIHTLNPTPGDPQQGDNRDTGILVKQIYDAEQAAVKLYTALEQATADTDPVTNDLVIKILGTEQNHVTDMIKLGYTIQAD